MQAVNKHLKSTYSSQFSSLKQNKNNIQRELLKKRSNNGKETNYSSSFRRQNKDKKRIDRQLSKQNQSQSRSRSKSVSSYCEAGCFRKGVSSNSNTKNNLNFQSQKGVKTKRMDEQKLYGAIQKFHFNLSSMPLDHLVTHTHPEQWLKQQKQTYQQLNQKLKRLEGEGKQNKKNSQNIKSSNLKIEEKTFQYYKSKVESIQEVLRNIENNMQMLMKLYQEQLRSYNSNSSIRSKESFQSPGFGFSLSSNQSTPTDDAKHQVRVKYQKKKANQNYKIQESLYQIHEKNSFQSSNQSDSNLTSRQNSSSNFNATETTQNAMWRQLQENIKKFMDCTIKNGAKNELQATTNKMMPTQAMAQMLSTCRTEQSPTHGRHKGETREKNIETVENSGEREKNYEKQSKRFAEDNRKSRQKDFVKFDLSTSRNRQDSNFETKQKAENVENGNSPSNNAIIQSISQFFAKSGILLKGNSVTMSEQLNNLLRNLGSQNGNAKLTQEKNVEKYKREEQRFCYKEPKMKPLLWEITGLKQQLKEKNKIIEQLLMRQQELQTVIDLFRHDEKQNKQSMNFSMERIKNLEAVINKYEKQMKRMENIDIQMRQSIKNQSIFVNALQAEKGVLQQKLENERQKILHMQREFIQATTKWENQFKKLVKGQKVALQKMEIYKQKYYQLLHEVELKKIVIKGEYSGKAAKLKQIWGILGQHRRNIYDIDEPQQQKIVEKQLKKNRVKMFENKDSLQTERNNRDIQLVKSSSNLILRQKREHDQVRVQNRKKYSVKEIMDLESQQSGVEESLMKNKQW